VGADAGAIVRGRRESDRLFARTLEGLLGASTAFYEELAIANFFIRRVITLGRSDYIPSFMKRKWHQKKRYIILSLIIFPPLGIPLVWLGKWHQNVKIGATVASTVLLMVALAAPPKEAKTANSSQTQQTPNTPSRCGSSCWETSGNAFGSLEEA
jgi:hypothetical protein